MGKVIRLDGSWVTSREAAEMMGCSLDYIHRLNALGVLVPVKPHSRACMYRRRDIERYIRTHPRLGRAASAR